VSNVSDGNSVAETAHLPVEEDSLHGTLADHRTTSAPRANNGRSNADDLQASPSSYGPSDSVTTPISADTLRNDVGNDVMTGSSEHHQTGVVKQLLDISSTLTRFLTMEYISDGGAFAQAFRSRYYFYYHFYYYYYHKRQFI